VANPNLESSSQRLTLFGDGAADDGDEIGGASFSATCAAFCAEMETAHKQVSSSA
jgi:hypothetical protein